MQRTAIQPAGDFVIGAFRLFHGEFFGVGGDALEGGIVALEPAQVDLGQLERCDLARPDELGELGQGQEGGVFEIGGTRHRLGCALMA